MIKLSKKPSLRVILILLLLAVTFMVYGLSLPVRSETAKTGKLTDRQMMKIMGGEEGCETFTDSTSCAGTHLFTISKSCEVAREVVIMTEEEYNDEYDKEEEPEAYEQYKTDHLPSCDFFVDLNITAGDGSSFDTARTGSDTSKKIKDTKEVHPCKRGHQCKNEQAPAAKLQVGPVRNSKGKERDGCVESKDPNKYCVSCITNYGQIMPDAAQPKKYECVDVE